MIKALRIRFPTVSATEYLLLGVTLALVVPFTTGGIGYYFEQGTISARPAYYLISLGTCLLPCIIAYGLKLNFSLLCLICLFLYRFIDATMLGRGWNTIENPSSAIGATMAYCVFLNCLTANRTILRLCAISCSVATILVCFLLNAWEWLNPGYFSAAPGRSAGWLGNPNDSAVAISCSLGLLLSLRIPAWMSAAAFSVSCLGVYFSLSRGGFIIVGAVAVGYLLTVLRRGLAFSLSVVALLAISGFMISQVVDFRGVDKDYVTERQAYFTGEGAMNLSQDARIELFWQGIDGIRAQPWFGYGPGSSWGFPFQPHNQFVGVWLDSGILGFALFVVAIGLLLRGCYLTDNQYLIGGVSLGLACLFSHGLLENKSIIFAWICLTGLACGGFGIKQPAPSVKRRRGANGPPIPREVLARRISSDPDEIKPSLVPSRVGLGQDHGRSLFKSEG